MNKIDTKLPIRFYDDRGKNETEVIVEKILFEDKETCLCQVSVDGDIEAIDEEFKRILFFKEDGRVLTENFQFWYAENYKK